MDESRLLRSRRIHPHARCGFGTRFRFRPKALPAALRKKDTRLRLRADAVWSGNDLLRSAEDTDRARVRRR
jgi:hypothetical protein